MFSAQTIFLSCRQKLLFSKNSRTSEMPKVKMRGVESPQLAMAGTPAGKHLKT